MIGKSMSGGKILDKIKIDLRNQSTGSLLPIMIDVYDNTLSRKWLDALNNLLKNNFHLEKNYCFLGFVEHQRNGRYILDQVNVAIETINRAGLGYQINDYFTVENTMNLDPIPEGSLSESKFIDDKMNQLHRYFEDLQGVSGLMTIYYEKADATTKWHIRQLNLLCHEFEAWVLSYHKMLQASDWQRPSQLMCWLQAPRFILEPEDYELFGVETINRSLGGVFVGVNKAVGKHHWEVFNDEGRDSRIGELITSTLRSQTEAAGDFDIEWGQDPSDYQWQQDRLNEFREWLIINGFDPEDKSLTIGHPKIGQVNLRDTFGTDNHRDIWKYLNTHLDVFSVSTSDQRAEYDYCWSDPDYAEQQIRVIERNER